MKKWQKIVLIVCGGVILVYFIAMLVFIAAQPSVNEKADELSAKINSAGVDSLA